MARVWQEGFENRLPTTDFLTGNPSSIVNGLSMPFPERCKLGAGRNSYSDASLRIDMPNETLDLSFCEKILDSSLDAMYFRAWFKYSNAQNATDEAIWFLSGGGDKLLGLYDNGSGSYSVYVRVGGVYTEYDSTILSIDTWYKIDIYLKIDSSTGAYEVRVNNNSISSGSSLNTGADNIVSVRFGFENSQTGFYKYSFWDDLAINDTTGSNNITWCGDGTIVGLKTTASGNYSSFSVCQGYATAETNSGTTQVVITNHSLGDDDVIYNVDRDEYRTVSVVDTHTLHVASVTNQTQSDKIIAFTFQETISASAGTSTAKVVISGHNVESYDVFVNTTRSNAIRRVIYVSSNDVYNYEQLAGLSYTDLGSIVTSQASGDDIRTYKVYQYSISDHSLAVSQDNPNPYFANIESSVSNDIDTFDMEELVANKDVPGNASIIAVSHNIYAKENGAGSKVYPIFRIGSTDYTGNTVSLIGDTLQYQTIYEESPATTDSWIVSEIDSLEAGVKVV